jgi:hypothetical protein
MLLLSEVHAQTVTCRVDPIITMSNGAQLTLYDVVQDTATDLKSVTYEVHIPKNVKVVSVAYDPTFGYLEHVTFVQDMVPGNYHTYTTAYTGKPATETAYATVGGTACHNSQTSQLTNTTPHTLPNQFNC